MSWFPWHTDKSFELSEKVKSKHLLNLPMRKRHALTNGVNPNKSDVTDRFRQVMLVEEFKRCVRDDIKIHSDEQNVQIFAKAASTLAKLKTMGLPNQLLSVAKSPMKCMNK